MEFLVADAERLFAEGGKVKNLSFWGYKIMTRSTLPSYQAPPLFPRVVAAPPTNSITGEGYVDYCTWHRFSDFEWLIAQLQLLFPGVVFPPIPDKDSDGTVDKLSDLFHGADSSDTSRDNDLVQKRIRHFQMFFDRVTTLTATHETEVVKAFVTMEEPEWLHYKERITQSQKGKAWDAIKSKGLGLISRLSAIGDKKPVAFPDGHPIAAIKRNMGNMGDSLRAAAMHMLYIKKYGHYAPEIKQEGGDAPDSTSTVANPVRVLPPTLVYNGHFVCEVSDRNKQGVVRHVEGATAWVDWGSGAPLCRIPVSQLCYPPSGVSDPTVFAAQELASQIDSFCTYLSFRPESRQLERLTDLMYFWSKHCHQVVGVTEQLQEMLEHLVIGEKDLGKMKEGAEKVATAARVAGMKERFETGCTALQASFQDMRQYLRKALLDIAHLFGNLSVSFLGDDEWEGRLQRADAALPLLFEPPQEVVDTLSQEAKSGHFVEYMPQPQARPQQAPPQQQQEQQQQQQAYGSAPQPATEPPQQQVPPPYVSSPATPPSPTPSPAGRPQEVTFVSAPPEDDVPPPPPPPQADEPVKTRGPSNSGFEQNWPAAPRTWEPEAAAGDLEPPPPPPPASHEA